MKVKEFELLSKFGLNFEVRYIVDNKEIPSTESAEVNSNINSNDTTQLFWELLNKFDGLSTCLRNGLNTCLARAFTRSGAT